MTPQGKSNGTLTWRWIFRVAGPPVAGGVVRVNGKRILAIEPHGYRRPDLDLGNVAVLPGLVNAHTHLDLSSLKGEGPLPTNFTDWLRAVIQQRRTTSPEQEFRNISTGLRQSSEFGTT